MADAQETIADIIAEKRRHADEIERDIAEKMKSGEMISDRYARELVADIRREAARLEAAYKREASGNTAALHEALKPVKRYLDGYTVNILELRRTVDAALTAPARNCDRFAISEEAWDAYDEWVESYRAKGETEPLNEFGWLFAPATEKEGGAK